jgi:hypothetical protein
MEKKKQQTKDVVAQKSQDAFHDEITDDEVSNVAPGQMERKQKWPE